MVRMFFATVLAVTVLCAVAKDGTPAAGLKARMERLKWSGVMVGHQDDTMYGISWKYEAGRSMPAEAS